MVLLAVERRIEGFSQTSDGRVLVRRGASNRALVGADLLREPHRVLGKTFVEIFRYHSEGSDYSRRVEIAGPLPTQIRSATTFVLDEIGHALVVVGVRRFDLPRLPEVVLRETVANALAHRSYEANGTPVQIEIRPDRIVVTSPGGLPEPVTIDNIREQQAARNHEVIRTLRRYGLAEDEGRGIDMMQDEMAYSLLEPPQFSEDGSSVSVTLPLSATVTLQERAWVTELQKRGSLEPQDSLLLAFASRGQILTNSEARRILGVDRDQARLALQRLRDEGLLMQRGERGGAEYLLHPDHGLLHGFHLLQEEIESLVTELARKGPVTNALVRERTGLDRVKAGSLLARLVSDGRLERHGERRGTHYVLPAVAVGWGEAEQARQEQVLDAPADL